MKTPNKSQKRTLALVLIVSSIIVLTGCSNIKESSNYETHNLKYLVNLSDVEDDAKEQKLKDLGKVLTKRLKKFDVDDISIDFFEEKDMQYISVNFGTTDDINQIKGELQENFAFNLKKKIEKSENYEEEIRNQAQEMLQMLTKGAPFETTAQNAVLEGNQNIAYYETDWMYQDEIKNVFTEVLFEMDPGDIYEDLIEYEEQPFVLSPPTKIASILKLFDKRVHERVLSSPKQVGVDHILIAFQGATKASEEIERTKVEAENIANSIKEKLDSGEDFAQLAGEYSDDMSNKDSGGELGTPAGNGVYVEEFEEAALELDKEGAISEIVESPFGFHIIKATSIIPAEEESSMENQAKFGVIFFAMVAPEWENTELTYEHLKSVDLMYNEEYDPYLILTFDQKGKQLLEEITENNMDNVLGVFAGKNMVTSFTVKDINSDGKLRILRPSKTEEADYLKEKLSMEPLPVPIILKPTTEEDNDQTEEETEFDKDGLEDEEEIEEEQSNDELNVTTE